MSTLQHFPMLSQLADTNEVNRQFDCVPTSIAAALQYLLGKPFDGGAIKDAVYGKNYTGGTAASEYVTYCKEQGVTLSPVDGTPAELTTRAHALLAQGLPVVFTEADPYVPASYGWTHVCVWYADSPGELTALDPYIGKPVTRTDGEWQAVMRFNQLWILERIDDMAITISSPGVGNYFVEVAADRWHCPSKKVDMAYAFLSHYKANNGLQTMRLPISGEIPIEDIAGGQFAHFAGHGIMVMYFEVGPYVYDKDHLVDNPPGAGDVYPLKVYEQGVGTDPRLFVLQKQLQAAQQGASSVQAEQALVVVKQVQALVKPF